MAKGKLHFIKDDSVKKTACGIDKERVETATYSMIVNCEKCRCSWQWFDSKK